MCDTLLRSFPSQQGLKLGGRPALSLRRCSATIPGLSLLPKGEKRRGHEDRGISTCSDTYKQGEGEILKGRTAKEQYSAYWEQRGQRSVDGPSERLANGHIHHIGVGFPLHQHGILPHPIEHDDGVVDGVPQNCEQSCHRGCRHQPARGCVDSHGQPHVMYEGGNGGKGELELKRQEMYRIIAAMATIIAISAFLPVSRPKLGPTSSILAAALSAPNCASRSLNIASYSALLSVLASTR